jgi:hypothetical protein
MSCHSQLPTYFISSTKTVERQVRKNREGEGDERIRSRGEEGGRKEGGSLPIKAVCGLFQKQQVWA